MNRDGAPDLITNNGVFLNDGRGIFTELRGGSNRVGPTRSIVVERYAGAGVPGPQRQQLKGQPVLAQAILATPEGSS